jgi:hypothetical protein
MLRILLFPAVIVFADLLHRAGITSLDTAVSPPRPQWPKEWSAEITIHNHTSNSSNNFNFFYSAANNASVSFYPTIDYLFLNGYKYTVYKNGTCNFNRTAEQLEVPPINQFRFAGIVKFKNQHLWWWENAEYMYGTQQTDEQEPVIAIDKIRNESLLWRKFTAISYWPQSLWRHPANCADRTSM